MVTVTASQVVVAARRMPGRAVRYLAAVMGADAYDRYRDNLALRYPDVAPLGEREFWRQHQDWQDDHPQGRCC